MISKLILWASLFLRLVYCTDSYNDSVVNDLAKRIGALEEKGEIV